MVTELIWDITITSTKLLRHSNYLPGYAQGNILKPLAEI